MLAGMQADSCRESVCVCVFRGMNTFENYTVKGTFFLFRSKSVEGYE